VNIDEFFNIGRILDKEVLIFLTMNTLKHCLANNANKAK
jgi:hypothetical protein